MYSYDRTATRPIPVDKAQARKLAQRIVKELPGELRFRPDEMANPINRQRGFRAGWVLPVGTFVTKDMKGALVEVPVRVQYKALEASGVRRWVAGGSIDTRYHGRGYGLKLALNLYVNSNAGAQALLDHLGEAEDEFYSVIIHEVTHLRDLLKHEYSGDTEGGTSKYHNSPTELRAFMQQIADEVLAEAHKAGKLVGAWGLGPSPSGDFVENLLWRSKTWNRIHWDLSPTSERLILRGVTRALQDEWSTLLKEYEDE